MASSMEDPLALIQIPMQKLTARAREGTCTIQEARERGSSPFVVNDESEPVSSIHHEGWPLAFSALYVTSKLFLNRSRVKVIGQ